MRESGAKTWELDNNTITRLVGLRYVIIHEIGCRIRNTGAIVWRLSLGILTLIS